MSESSIPAYVDTRKAFLQEGTIGGEVSLDKLPRFLEGLANDAGTVSVELSFDLNESKQRIISGHLRAEVEVVCQRCLEQAPPVLARRRVLDKNCHQALPEDRIGLLNDHLFHVPPAAAQASRDFRRNRFSDTRLNVLSDNLNCVLIECFPLADS